MSKLWQSTPVLGQMALIYFGIFVAMWAAIKIFNAMFPPEKEN